MCRKPDTVRNPKEEKIIMIEVEEMKKKGEAKDDLINVVSG